MEIKLTHEESEQYFLNALCNCPGISGCSLEYIKEEYKVAKSKLTSPCIEDVQMQILRDGGTLTMVDEEGEGDMTRSITLKDVHDRVEKTPLWALQQMIDEEDDGETADIIIQTVFFEEIVFG